mgnify:FL=1
MAKRKRGREQELTNKNDSMLFAFLATFLSIIGFIIALIAKRDDKYVMYYAKQSLVVFIATLLLSAAGWVFWGIITLLWLGNLLWWIAQLIIFLLWLISWVNALSGKMKPTPVIGHFARNFKL